jgi:hypothetical protein
MTGGSVLINNAVVAGHGDRQVTIAGGLTIRVNLPSALSPARVHGLMIARITDAL